MKKLWKGILKKAKLLSVLFGAISLACLTAIIAINLTVKPEEGKQEEVAFTHPKSYYDSLGAIERTYLNFTNYTTAAAAPDGKTAGTWLTGIDVNSMPGGWPTYVANHPALVVPESLDALTPVVGVDLATNGYKSSSGGQYVQAVAFIEKIVIPKSVKSIIGASFYGFSKLGYLEIPFVGTERGSSAKGMSMDISQILASSTPTSDSFGSMFGLPNPNIVTGGWTQGDTSYWYKDPANSAFYEPRTCRWREIDDGLASSNFYLYQIPDKMDFLYITDETKIGNYALNSCSAKHVEVTASDEVKNECFIFGAYAFAESGCIPTTEPGKGPNDPGVRGLEEIKLHMKGFIDFRIGTFDKCETLKKLTVPYVSSNLIIPEAFLNQALSLTEVYIPGSVTSIGKGAFKGCEALERISVYTCDSELLAEDYATDHAAGRLYNSSYKFYLPTGLKTIGMDAFNGCKTLDTIYVPNTVTEIGFNAYSGCTKVTKAILPFVGAHAGNCNNNCTNSTTKGNAGKKTQHGLFGWIFGNDAGAENCYVARQQYVDRDTDGNPIVSIAFTIPSSLTDVTITNETHLTTGCFQGLSSLKEVTINDAVYNNIALGCFDQCGSLQKLTIPYIVGGNLGALFQGTENFDGSENTIGNNYRVPSTLKEVCVTNMPDASGALFHECANLTTVEFSKKTTNFGHGIFHNNQKLQKLILPFVGMERGEFYRWWWWWRDIRYRNTLMWLFSEDYQTDTYRNTSQLYEDKYYAAYIPTSLTHVTITDETCFGGYSFQGFTSLKNISITNTPSYIAEYSFWNCSSLESLQLPYIGNDLNPNGYSGASHVLGWIFGRSNYGNSYPAVQAGTTYYIPNGLETVEIGTADTPTKNLSNKIFDDAFRNCSSLVTVDFKKAIIDGLGNGAFANCSRLNELIYPNARFTHVGNSAFLNCKTIKRLKDAGPDKKGIIPNTVTTIGNYAFSGTSVGYLDTDKYADNYLDLSTYTSLGDYAFSNCLQINQVTVPNNIAYVGAGLFADCSYLADVNLINKNVSPYMFQNCVSLEGIDFKNIINIPDGVFSGCSNLSFAGGLELDPSIETIGAYSFAGCSSMESNKDDETRFELPPTLKSIGKGAFQRCTSLDHMTIPKETTVIDPEGWIGCDDNFYFWVYNREEKWPKTWVQNWNCDYPVYVLGDDSEEIFTYTYRTDERKYYITGITKEAFDAGLTGLIRIPATHNGVAVVGINEAWRSDEDIANGARNIGTQINVTGFILPKGVAKIYGSPFQTGARVDIYTEYTEAEILKIYEESKKAAEDAYVEWESNQVNPSDTDKQNKKLDLFGKIKGWKPFQANSDGIALAPTTSVDPWDARNWTSGGMLYYYDYWRYGTGMSATVPFLRVEKLKFTFDEYALLDASYTGSAVEVPVVQIQLPGELFINEGLDLTVENLMYVYEWDTNIMNYLYSNNVNVGTAKVDVTVNNTNLDTYNLSYPEKERYPLRLLGSTTLHYQIQPIEITLIATANDGLWYEKTYDGSPFSYNQWQSGQISGLEGFPGAVFSGTIATPSANANNDKHPEYMGNELKWTTPYKVRINNVDVTSNFRVTPLFSVIINPMEVELVWAISDEPIDGVYQIAEKDTAQHDNKDVYLYPYIGGNIYPKAIARKFGGAADEYVPECKMYVTIPNTVGKYPYETVPDYYYMYGGITGACSNNYKLVAVDSSGNKYTPIVTPNVTTQLEAVDAYYKITKGRIVVNFDLDYLIAPTENEWSYTWGISSPELGVFEPVDNRTYITGLGENSRFIGKLASSSDAKASYSYTPSDGKVFKASGPGVYLLSWQDLSFNYSGVSTDGSNQSYTVSFTATEDHPYHIWNPVLGIADETEYYDVEMKAHIDILYRDFEPTWFIGLNGPDYETVKNPDYITVQNDIIQKTVDNLAGGGQETRTYYYWKYEVDGQEYRFSAEDLNVLKNKYPDYEILYHKDNGESLSAQDVTFTDLGDHVFSVTLSARHYNVVQYNIWIEAVKSHVKINSLTKVYDRLPVDLDSCIAKIGSDQRAQIKVTYMDQYGTELLASPIDVGKYKAHIVIPEGAFFHAYDEILDFEILPRPIYVDVTKGPQGPSKVFDNQPYQIDLSKLDLATSTEHPNSGLLSGDVIQGILQTSSFVPGEYDSEAIYNSSATAGNFSFKWAANWLVTYVGNFSDVSKNYKIVLNGIFEIKPLQFEYTVYDNFGVQITDVDEKGHLVQNFDFDSKIHYIRVDVTYPMPGNYLPAPTPSRQIFYSDQELGESSSLWLNTPPTCSAPGEYKIYYMIKADYFETIIDYVTINIAELKIEYNDPATSDGDGIDEMYTVEYDGTNHTYEIEVIKPSFSATVYYSVDGGKETLEAPMFKEVGDYKVKYRITAPNYTEVIKEVTVRVTQPGEPLPDSSIVYNFFDGVYDGLPHTAVGEFESSFVAAQPAGFWSKVLYSNNEGKDWSEFQFEYTEIGKYPVWIKYQAKGYQDQIVKGEVVIKGKPLLLTTSPVKVVFDNKYHNIDLVAGAGVTLTKDSDTGVYTYADSTCPAGVELKLSYTLDPNAAHADSGWITGPGYKDVGQYPVYLKVEAENYEPLIFENMTELIIQFLENPEATMESPQIFEYSKSPLKVEQLVIDTPADGVRTAYWYSAHIGAGGVLEQDLPAERVSAPQELGVYYVEVQISPSKNTGGVKVSGFVQIVPRKLEVKWDSPQYYDGTIKNPNAYVETGTSDEISLLYSVQGGASPIEVGSYVFDVSMANPNPNYVLDRDTFVLEIIKRNVLFKLDEEHVVKDGLAKWNEKDSEYYDKSDQCPGDDHWHLLGDLHGVANKWDSTEGKYVETTFAGLSPNHLFYAELETSAGVRGDYHYSTITNEFFINSVRILKWDIYEKDSNNNIVIKGGQPVSVKEYYDVDFDIVIRLTNPKIDLDSIEMITEYVYDGLPHAIYFNVPTSYGSAYVYYKDDDNRWTTTPLRRTFVGEYPVDFYVGALGYEDTYGTAILKITPADLKIEIGDMYKKTDTTKALHEKYDATAHLNKYTVTNLKCDPIPPATHIRYYDAKTCKEEDVRALYQNFNPDSELYKSGLDALVDAGQYYCVVYYEEDTNKWHKSFAIKQVTLLPRNINIEFPSGSMPDIRVTYNGSPVSIPLANAIIDTKVSSDGLDGLLPSHTINTTPDALKQYFVQTISANAGAYPLDTGFEFLAIDIREQASGKPVKMSNYHPVLKGDFYVEILRKYLEDHEFYLLVEQYIKEYDGKVHTPDYFEDGDYYCASDGELNMTFTELLPGGGRNLCTGPQKNAGTYEVILGIDQGTNYYSSYASAAAMKPGGTPFLSYPTIKYTVICTPKTVTVKWDKLEQKFNGEVLSPVATFNDAETDPKNPVDVQLKITYFDNDARAFIAKNIINAGLYLALADFDTTTAKGRDYAKNYVLDTKTTSAKFTVDKLRLTLQLGDGGDSNKIVYYSSTSAWFTEVYKTPTAGAAEFIAEGDADAQAWIDKMVISALTSDDGIPTVSTAAVADISDLCKTYSDQTDFDYNIRFKTPTGIDVTDSIEYSIKDSVTIIADEIVYELKDYVEVMYREAKGDVGATGYNFNELNCLKVLNPSDYSIDHYKINGEIANVTDRMTNAGDYVLTFDITSPNRTTQSVEVRVKILQRSAYMIFTKDLSKVYDASPVDAMTLVDMNLSGFNGEKSDLVCTYYEIDDKGLETQLTEAPTNVGNYRVHIISNADSNPSVAKNYTTLEINRAFSITPKPIDLTYELDLELTDDSKLGQPWEVNKVALAGDVPGVFSGDSLQYAFRMEDLQRGEYIGKKAFPNSKNNAYQEFTADNGTIVKFAWIVYDANDDGSLKTHKVWVSDGKGGMTQVDQNIDISSNYQINLSFRLLVHYPYIPVEIEGLEIPYDGDSHHGTIKFSDDKKGVHNAAWYQANVIQHYSESADNVETSTIQTIDHPNISKSEPGTYTIYYVLKVDPAKTTEKYEEKVGSFTIKINKLDRELTVTNPTKDYDGIPAGVQMTGTSTTRWFPEHEIATRAFADIFDYDNVDIKYYLGKEPIDATTGCIESGTYSYSLRIPATAYYNETTAAGIFYINRIKIYIADDTVGAGAASYPYNAMVKTFDFNYNPTTLQQNAQNNYTLYTKDSTGVPTLLSAQNLLFRSQLITNDKEVKTYKGKDGTLTVFAYEYEVFDAINKADVTNNYVLDIANASINITNLDMKWTSEEAVYVYDGELHDFNIMFSTPNKNKVTIQYFDGANYVTTPIRYRDCGTYECKVRFLATNYEPVETTVKMTILRAPTKVIHVTGLGKTYDGAEVTLPEEIFTNRDLADEENQRNSYTYEYFRYDYTTGEYSTMPMYTQNPIISIDKDGKEVITTQHTGVRPIDVGRYKIRIHLPAVQNFEEATYEAEFEIGQRETSVNWVGSSFVYDGTPKSPEALMKLTAEDIKNGVVVKLKYTYEANGAPNDPTHTAAGFYTAKASIDYANSSPKAQNYKIDLASESYPFRIVPRPIEIKFSRRGVGDIDPLHNYTIKHELSPAANPDTPYTFTVNNIVSGHVIKDYLKVNYDVTRIYHTVDDFAWMNYQTNDGLTAPRILDALGNEVQNNYIVVSYSYLFELTTDPSAIERELVSYEGEYDGLPHTFKFNITGGKTKEDFIINYRIRVVSGGNGVTGTGNKFVSSSTFDAPEYQPKFTNVGEYIIEVQICTLTGEEIVVDQVSVKITQADPDLQPTKLDYTLKKIYDGIPVENPEMDYKDKQPGDNLLKYTYYKYNETTKDYDQLADNPKEVGDYQLKIEFLGNNNYKPISYTPIAFQITPRTIVITVPPTVSTKLYDGIPWSTVITDANVNEKTADMGLADNQTLVNRVTKKNQKLYLLKTDAGTYSYSSNPSDFTWDDGAPMCKIYDENNMEVQDNYVVQYVANITIRQREFAYEFDPLIAKYEAGTSYFVKVIINGTYNEDGSVGPNYINASDIQILYSLDKDFTSPSPTPIPITSPGHTLVWAKITGGDNIKPILTYAPVYLYEDDGGDDNDDDLPKEPNDAENDPENVKFEKIKVYDGHPYTDPQFIGHQASDRTTSVVYYTYEYYKECQDKKVPLDPTKAISTPINKGDYVFVLDVDPSPDGTDPARHYEQIFRIKPKTVAAEWEDLIVYIPKGKTRLDEPAYPKAKFLANGKYIDLVVGPNPAGEVEEGTYIVNASLAVPDPNYRLTNLNQVFEITTDADKVPKPNDAETRSDIEFDKTKVYDKDPYKDPIFTGHNAATRVPTIEYYTWDYYNDNLGVLNSADKLSGAPINVGKYVFVMTIPADPADPVNYPAETVRQYFTITPRPVTVKWENLTFVHDGTEHKPTATFEDMDKKIVNCEVKPGYDFVGKDLPVIALSPDPNYSISNPNAKITITGVEIDPVDIAPGQKLEYKNPIILYTTDPAPDYYISKEDYDADNTIVPISDWSKVFLVDKDGVIYKWDATTTTWIDANRPYTMKFDVNRDAGTHKVITSLKDKAQTSWKGLTSDDIAKDYEITALVVPNSEYDVEYSYTRIWKYTGSEIKPPVVVKLVLRSNPAIVDELDPLTDFKVEYKDNINPTEKAVIEIQGKGNYSFSKLDYFSIVKNARLLELLPDAKAAWITAIVNEDSTVTFDGEDDNTAAPLVRKTAKQQDMYLGRLHQETTIEDMLKQFVGYAEKPSDFAVKKIATTPTDLASPDIDSEGYIPIDPSEFATALFGNGMKICLMTDQGDGTSKITDEVVAILHGDLDGDGFVNLNDLSSAGNFVSSGGNLGSVPRYTYFAGVTRRDNLFFNLNTISDIGALINNGIDFNEFGGIYTK